MFLPVGIAFAVAAGCLAALAWDGSGYLFNALQDGRPLISHHRYSNLPVLWAVVLASHVVDGPLLLAVLYGLLLALVPVGSLALCFAFLRDERLKALRVWPVLGILVAALPGQICVMSEATLLVQAFWPVLAILAAGLPAVGLAWLAVLIPYLFFLHPLAAPLFGLAAVLAVAVGWIRNDGWRGVSVGVVFAVAAVVRVWFAVVTATPYERGEFAWEPNMNAMAGSLHGWPSVMLAMMFVMAWAALAGSFGWLDARRAGWWFRWAAVGLAASGCLWAVAPDLWAGALGYRRFALLLSLPLFAAGGLHWWGLNRRDVRPRSVPLGWPAVAFSLVLVAQSIAWRGEVTRFVGDLRDVSKPLASKADVPWIERRPLDHWGASFVALFVQGREPETLFSLEGEPVEDGRFLLYDSEFLATRDGWFQLAGIGSKAEGVSVTED